MLRYASCVGATAGRIVALAVIAVTVALVWLAADRESGQGSAGRFVIRLGRWWRRG